jgi:hypothetical protein
MTYAPINIDAYTNAYSGAVAGMAVSGWITDPTSAEYSNVAAVGGAFAQAFDVVWNDATALNWLQIQSIQSVCQQQFAGHAPSDNTALTQPSNWAVPAAACAALVLEVDAFVASEGITPNSPGSGGGAVTSVFARIGAVVAALNDYAASLVSNDSSVAGSTVKDALNTLLAAIAAIPSAPVSSVFTRTGAIVATLNDYAASLVSNNSSVVGSTVKDALNTLLAAIPSVPVSSVFTRTGAIVATLNDYAASLVSNNSSVTGATVKDALDTLLGSTLPVSGWMRATDATSSFDTSPALNVLAVVQGANWTYVGSAALTRSGAVLTYTGPTRTLLIRAYAAVHLAAVNAVVGLGISINNDLNGQAVGSAPELAAGVMYSNQVTTGGTVLLACERRVVITTGQTIQLVGCTATGAVDVAIDRAGMIVELN